MRGSGPSIDRNPSSGTDCVRATFSDKGRREVGASGMRCVFAVDLLRSSDPPHHRRREIPKRRRAKLLHGVAGLGAQDSKYALNTWLTESA